MIDRYVFLDDSNMVAMYTLNFARFNFFFLGLNLSRVLDPPLRQSSYMSHILKGLSKRNIHIPHIVLYGEDKWQKNVF